MHTITAGLIGLGSINRGMRKRMEAKGHIVTFVVRTSGVYDGSGKKFIAPLKELPNFCQQNRVTYVSLAIPTVDNGEKELQHILDVLGAGTFISMCCKGARANFDDVLSQKEVLMGPVIGDTAICGGGTMMAEYIRLRSLDCIERIDCSVNGSCNASWNMLSKGASQEETFAQAKEARILEPGSSSFHEAILAEACSDVPRKGFVLSKKIGICPKERRAMDVVCASFTSDDFEKLVMEATEWRIVVSLYRKEIEPPEGISLTAVPFGDWNLFFGWRNLRKEPLLQRLVGPGASNTLIISEIGHGPEEAYVLQGPGAGVIPTTSAMMADVERLMKRHI